MSEKVWFIKRCNLFQQLSPDELRDLERRALVRRFGRKSPIYLPADEADSVLLLAAGRVKICNFTMDGKQAILAFIEPGEIFGELALFETDQREEHAEALEASTVVLLPGDAIQRLLERRPEISLGVTRMMGLRRRRIERRLKNLLFRSNRERLAHLLLELAEQYGRRTDEGVQLGIKLSHQDLASVVGSTRETVTVVLGELQAEGFLTIGRRRIVIRDLQRLAQSVQSTPPHLPQESTPPTPRAGSVLPVRPPT